MDSRTLQAENGLAYKLINVLKQKIMVEFKIQLEESVVETLGYQEVEKRLEDFTQKLILKLAAQDILEDLQNVDLETDKEWQMARNLAWEQEKHKYLVD